MLQAVPSSSLHQNRQYKMRPSTSYRAVQNPSAPINRRLRTTSYVHTPSLVTRSPLHHTQCLRLFCACNKNITGEKAILSRYQKGHKAATIQSQSPQFQATMKPSQRKVKGRVTSLALHCLAGLSTANSSLPPSHSSQILSTCHSPSCSHTPSQSPRQRGSAHTLKMPPLRADTKGCAPPWLGATLTLRLATPPSPAPPAPASMAATALVWFWSRSPAPSPRHPPRRVVAPVGGTGGCAAFSCSSP